MGDLSSFQQKSLEELRDMLRAETTTDEVNKKRGKCQGGSYVHQTYVSAYFSLSSRIILKSLEHVEIA